MKTFRLVVFIMVALLTAITLASPAFAAGDPVANRVSATNTVIEYKIENAVTSAELAYNTALNRIDAVLMQLDGRRITQEKARATIGGILAVYEAQLDSIAARLITSTDRMAFNLVEFGGRFDVVILNEYVEVQLGSRTYLVDPLRVVGN